MELEILKRRYKNILQIYNKLIANNVNDKHTKFWKEKLVKVEAEIIIYILN